MSQAAFSRLSLAAGCLLLAAACNAPSLTNLPMAANPAAMAAAKPAVKFVPGIAWNKEDKPIAGDGGMRVQASLPPSADLRPQMSPVANQQDLGACTAFTYIKGLREFMARKEGRTQPLSARFFWYASRQLVDQALHPSPDERYLTHNTGLPSMSFGAKALKVLGTVTETTFPYPTLAEFAAVGKLPDEQQAAKFHEMASVAPPKAAFDAAKSYRVSQTLYEADSVHAMRKALSDGHPVALAVMLCQSFCTKEVKATGRVPMPKLPSEKFVGGHAMTAVGYDNAQRVFIIRNSWGPDWGDHGYCYIPYDYFNLKTPEGYPIAFGGYTYRD
jgi:C1A family cysteine protease